MIYKYALRYKPIQSGSIIGIGAMMVAGGAHGAVVSNNGVVTKLQPSKENQLRSFTIPGTGVTVNNRVGDTGKNYSAALSLRAPVSGFVTDNVGLGTVIGAFSPQSAGRDIRELSGGKDANTSAFTNSGLYGFSFIGANNVSNYGWVSLTATYDGLKNANSLVATINGWAYTTAGENIIAGAPTATTSVPEADALAMLAAGVGLIGLTAQRRRKSTVNKSQASVALAA